MQKENSLFLSIRLYKNGKMLLYDYISFVLFLVFVAICLIIGKPLYYIDKRTGTHLVEQLIRFFEFFAR
ncbi:MAG: hypothetical protein RIR11_963 [Bacteroidota bacterium]|jgi:hypothetical protein